jgi:hypothetical protein
MPIAVTCLIFISIVSAVKVFKEAEREKNQGGEPERTIHRVRSIPVKGTIWDGVQKPVFFNKKYMIYPIPFPVTLGS